METFRCTLWIALAAWSFMGCCACGKCWSKIEKIPKWYKKVLFMCMFGPFVVVGTVAFLLLIGVLIALEWLFNKSKIENVYCYICTKFNNWLMK